MARFAADLFADDLYLNDGTHHCLIARLVFFSLRPWAQERKELASEYQSILMDMIPHMLLNEMIVIQESAERPKEPN